MNQFRTDPISGEMVVISEKRSRRPREFSTKIVTQKNILCPFCRGNEKLTPPTVEAIGNPWRVRCIENMYPALDYSGRLRWTGSFFRSGSAYGRHEVIIETPHHGQLLPEMTARELTEVLEMYLRRHNCLYREFPYVLIFHNYGKDAGASLAHLHAQVTALPFEPEAQMKKTKRFFVYKKKTGRCIMCDLLKKEKSERLVFENDSYKIITPWASKWKYETWIVPKAHASNLSGQSLGEFAHALLTLSRAYGKLLGQFSYNYLLHTVKAEGSFHSYIDFFPKLAIPAGFEYGTGTFINTVSPEEAARQLREVL